MKRISLILLIAANIAFVGAWCLGIVKLYRIRDGSVAVLLDLRTKATPAPQRISNGDWMWNDRRAMMLQPTPSPKSGEWMQTAKTGLQPAKLEMKR